MPLTNSGLCYGRGQVLRRGGGRGGRGVGNNWIGRQGLERLAEGAPVVVSKGWLSDTNARLSCCQPRRYLQVVFIHEQCFAQIPACEIMKMPFACQQANILILLVSDIFALCLTMQIEVSEQDVEQVILIDAHAFHCMRALAALHSC